MDVTIQSQIQSPLVRTLQSIPTNSANYVYGIPDNTPPFSRTQIRVQSTTGEESDLNAARVFKIPQFGRLNRAYLKYRCNGLQDTFSRVTTQYTDNVFSFSEGIEYVELRSHNSTIQRIYSDAIPFEAISTTGSENNLKRVLQGLAGYLGITGGIKDEPAIFSQPARQGEATFSDEDEYAVRDYLIPIPLASTFYLKDNLQTRLMEDLEIVVKTRRASNQFQPLISQVQYPGSGTHELELVLDFINFHESVEEVIRNENFKPDIPATLLQSDYLLYKANYLRSEPANGSSSFTALTYEASLPTDALVTNLYIVPYMRTPGYEYRRPIQLTKGSLKFELLSSGESIISGYKHEYDGIESQNYSTVTRQYQNESTLPLRWSSAGTHIRLGLNNTDEYFDGGISFSSLIDAKMRITYTILNSSPLIIQTDVGSNETTTIDVNPELISFDVCLKHKVLLRIDGNTGKISKSLES